MSNKHTEIVKIGNSITIISGVPDECKHEWNGPSYYITKSGKYVNYRTHTKWISYTDSFRQQLIMEHYKNIDDEIIEGGVTCSICNKPFQPKYF